VLTEFT